jgi:hypothetical protein
VYNNPVSLLIEQTQMGYSADDIAVATNLQLLVVRLFFNMRAN